MTYRWRILAASAALLMVAGFASEAAAFPFLPTQRNNQQRFIPQTYRPNYRVPTNRNIRPNTNANAKKHSATEMVLQNLQVAQTDLEKKNTSDALLQLQGSENILANWKNYQIAADKNVAAADVEKALKSVREARSSLNSKKLDDANSSIADAVAALKTNNGNGNKKKNNNN